MDLFTKVNGAGPVGSVKSSRPTSVKGPDKNSASKFQSTTTKETPGTAAPSQSYAVTALDSILFNDSSGGQKQRQQLIKRGETLLDQLEKIHLDLLSGKVKREDLLAIKNMLQNRPNLGDDKELKALLLEIETRAAVELAKLGID